MATTARTHGDGGAAHFHAGAWSRGPLVGCTKSMRESPNTYSPASSMDWITLSGSVPLPYFTFALNVLSAPHRDMQSNVKFPEHYSALLEWEGGHLWLRDPRGAIALSPDGPTGRLIEIDIPTRFSPSTEHATTPWAGNRLVLIGFHTNHTRKFDASARVQLLAMGFNPEWC